METLVLLKANIRHKKGAFKSIVVLMLIISLSLTAIISINDNNVRNLHNANDNVDTGDIVVFISGTFANEDMMNKLKNHPAIGRIKESDALVALDLTVNEEAASSRCMLLKYDLKDFKYPVYNKSRTGFDTAAPSLEKGEIYVPLSFTSLYDCSEGSLITVKTKGKEKTFTIKGFIEEPFIGAYFIGIKSLFITDSDFMELLSYADRETDAVLQLLEYRMFHLFESENTDLSIPQFKRQLNNDTGLLDYSYATLSRDDSMHYTMVFNNIGTGLLYAFVILLFVIVMIVMGNSISTGIEMDYTNIGVLKSQGFTKGKIRQVLTLQYLTAQLLGAFIGILLAIPLIKVLGGIFQPITGILATAQVSFLKCFATMAAILLMGSLFVFVKTARVGRISPLRALAGGRESIYFDSRLNLSMARRALDGRMALREFTSNKRQYLSLIIIVAILVYFMMSMTILAGSMNPRAVGESYGTIYSDVYLKLNNSFSMDKIQVIEEEAGKITPVEYSVYTANYYFSVDGNEYYASMFNDPRKIKSVTQGRVPLYDNEIVVTEILAQELGKHMGDTVTLGFRGGREEYIISGYYESMNDVGRCFALSLEAASRLYPMVAQYGFLDLNGSQEKERVIERLNTQFGDILTAQESEQSNMEDIVSVSLNGITVLIYAISILFTLVVVSMVCSRTFVKERQNIGIYKAVGFTTRRLRLQFALRFLFISVIGAVAGNVMCIFFNNQMMNALLKTMGVTNFTTEYTLLNVLLPSILIGLCFFVFSYLSSSKIKSVAVRELIVE